MKIRNGFVSNSSSSSFIVVFPSKPKDTDELKEMMFPGKTDDDHVTAYDNVAHVKEVVSTVFSETTDESATLEAIIEEFDSGWRYGYETNYGREGRFYGEGENYFGTDVESTEQLKKLCAEYEDLKNKYDEINRNIIIRLESQLGKRPDYSTEKEAYTKYCDDLNNLKSDDTEYQEHHKVNMWNHPLNDKITELEKKCCEADAKAFIADAKDGFIGIYEYSDNDVSFGCLMEHGDIFSNLKYMCFSHH